MRSFKKIQDDVSQAVKDVGHSSLKCGISISKAKGHDAIEICNTRGSKGGLILVLGVNVDLVVSAKTIH